MDFVYGIVVSGILFVLNATAFGILTTPLYPYSICQKLHRPILTLFCRVTPYRVHRSGGHVPAASSRLIPL
jgi:hypothetical protein